MRWRLLGRRRCNDADKTTDHALPDVSQNMPPTTGDTAEIRNCSFLYQCPKTWDALTSTAKPLEHFCDQCQRVMHYCRTNEQLRSAIEKNQCVAVEIKGKPRAAKRVLVGDPLP